MYIYSICIYTVYIYIYIYMYIYSIYIYIQYIYIYTYIIDIMQFCCYRPGCSTPAASGASEPSDLRWDDGKSMVKHLFLWVISHGELLVITRGYMYYIYIYVHYD